MPHLVLLGDSIFDNAAYVAGGPDVISQVRERLPRGWTASLLAVDGSVTADVAGQLRRLPRDATHIVVSVGGNDALGHIDILNERARSAAEVLRRLAEMSETFESGYRAMLGRVRASGLRVALCTIYNPRFPDREVQRLAVTALMVFNDAIVRAAVVAGAPLIDLRLICSDDADYANPIEPSSRGGAKIAAAIADLVGTHAFGGRTEVFAHGHAAPHASD